MAPRDKPAKPEDVVVFSVVRESACSECLAGILEGNLLRMEKDRPLCMACADLDHMVFLPRGDTALTRRAGKHSRLRVVVVRFNRSRNRYERQGLLVEEAALERAERECLDDADARARARKRAEERRRLEDAEYISAFAARAGELYPRCPEEDRAAIARHSCTRHSGRIGRTAAAKQLDADAIDLAVRAHVRHAHTRYDLMLGKGVERAEARLRVQPDIERVLTSWRGAGGR